MVVDNNNFFTVVTNDVVMMMFARFCKFIASGSIAEITATENFDFFEARQAAVDGGEVADALSNQFVNFFRSEWSMFIDECLKDRLAWAGELEVALF